MKEHRVALTGSVIAILALSAATGHAFLFENGRFDNPMPDFTDGSGWEGFGTPDAGTAIGWEDWGNGAPGSPPGVYSQTGDDQRGLVFKAYSASDGGFYHDVPVAPGQQYDFHVQSHTASGFYNQILAGGSGTVSIVFAWYDGDPETSGSLVSNAINDITSQIMDGGNDGTFPTGPSKPANWQNWDYTLIAPAGSAYLRSTIQWTAPSTIGGGDEALRWDNAELTTTLDPLNDSQQTEPVFELTFQTQTNVTHTVESSIDQQNWIDAGLPQVVGNDATQQVYVLPDAPVSYRLSHER